MDLTSAMLTLDDLKSACAAHLDADLATQAPTSPLGDQEKRHRVAGVVTDHFVRYAKLHKPRSEGEQERMRRRVGRKSGKQLAGFGGLLIGGLLSWLIAKCLDWLWNWWRGANAEAAVQLMAVPSYLDGTYETTDDEDE